MGGQKHFRSIIITFPGLLTRSTMWCPPVLSCFVTPSNYGYLPTINHSEIVVVFSNLAIYIGGHLVQCPGGYHLPPMAGKKATLRFHQTWQWKMDRLSVICGD